MAEGLARYKLDKNPFIIDRALNPLEHQEDEHLLVHVDGFGSINDIDEYLQTAINAKRAAFFMITGKSGTGRSTFANYVLARYCLLTNIPTNKLIIPDREYTGHDKVYIIKQWFGFLRTEINSRKIRLDDEVKTDLQNYLEKTKIDTLEPDFKDIAQRIADEIATTVNGPYAMACCMEDIEDFTVIDAAVKIFLNVPMVCVFTVRDYHEEQSEIIGPFKERAKKLTGSRIFELSQLSGNEIKTLVSRRWEYCCKLQNPFDLECIEKVFSDKHRTIGLCLTIIGNLIQNKLANNPIGEEWPDARELEFTCTQLRQLVPMLEKNL